MAIRPDDITVSPTGGAVLSEIPVDLTTQLGVYVQLRGAAVTAASAECIVTHGGQSLILTHTIASGEVTAPITEANLSTLGATIGSRLTAWFEGTVTDGAETVPWRYEMALMVSDRALRFPFDYSRFTARMASFGRACSIPAGQTNHWPQIRLGLEDLRDAINSQRSDVKTALIGREGILRQLAEVWGTEAAVGAALVRTNADPRTSSMAATYADLRAAKKTSIADAIVTLRDGSAWQTEGPAIERGVANVRIFNGHGRGPGGAL